MLASKQEEFFKLVRKECPTWSSVRASGYVHGYADESKQDKPTGGWVARFIKKDEYAIGYLIGFVLRRGADMEIESWYPRLAKYLEHVPDAIR